MCKQLSTLGYRVTVYNDPGADEGDIDGVTYLPYYKLNTADHFNILIAWRQPEFFKQDLNFNKGYIWAHDLLNPLVFTPEILDKITKVIVQSPFHRSNIPDVPDSKILISSNGIW